MQVIVVSGEKSVARTLSFDWRHWCALAFGLLALILGSTAGLNYLTLKYAVLSDHPVVRAVMLADQKAAAAKNEQFVQAHLSTLAVRLGELQAQMLRLDGLGDKLARLAGLKPTELPAPVPTMALPPAGGASADKKSLPGLPGRGGPEQSSQPERAWSIDEFNRILAELQRNIENKGDQLSVLEALLVEDSAQRKFLPSLNPIPNGNYFSNFGYRIDPFSGGQAYHDGIDFAADVGTAILAAASGKVVAAETHPGYGKMIDIDHGNGLVTRYAHASKLLVDVDALVVRGQKIAEVGNTGRSTGPHLHFEVRLNGTPQNPVRFIAGK